tara:strand:- start:456 stop:665 length:210 start_codon:yes stop_codon:yes gene_type:complete
MKYETKTKEEIGYEEMMAEMENHPELFQFAMEKLRNLTVADLREHTMWMSRAQRQALISLVINEMEMVA